MALIDGRDNVNNDDNRNDDVSRVTVLLIVIMGEEGNSDRNDNYDKKIGKIIL